MKPNEAATSLFVQVTCSGRDSRNCCRELFSVLPFFRTEGPGKANAEVSGCDHALSPACSSLESSEMLLIVCSSILSIVLAEISLLTLPTRY
eukprot:s1043_g9.t1